MTNIAGGYSDEYSRVAAWIDRYYKADRLNRYEGRREAIIDDRVSDLIRYGKTVISRHESVTGEPLWIYRETSAA